MEKKSLKITIIIIISIALVLIPLFKIFYDNYQDKRLEKTGVPAKAIILDIKDTYNRFNDQPQVKILLEVQPEGKASYKTEIKMIISPVYLPQFQPGARVNVLYDPKDPMKVVVVSVEPNQKK